MPSDSVNLKYLANELNEMLSGGRINKITMPLKDTVILTVRNGGISYPVLLCANPAHPRCHVTAAEYENPETAPSFLMHLRKHIGNGRILKIETVPFERIINISIMSKSELSIDQNYTLCIEIMGKHSNIILLNSDKVVTESIRHITPDISSKRVILPGIRYVTAPPQSKLDCSDENILISFLSTFKGGRIDTFIANGVSGFANATISDIVFEVLKSKEAAGFSDKNSHELANALVNIYKEKSINPCVGIRNGVPSDFYFKPYKSLADTSFTFFNTFSKAIDFYYSEGRKVTEFDRKVERLNTVVKNAIAKSEKRIAAAMNKIAECDDAENDKLFGELITANIFKIKKGMQGIEAENYYLEDMPKVKIALDENLSPQANAQKYFKRYTKKKGTVKNNTLLAQNAADETEYLKSVMLSVSLCSDKTDIEQIENELIQSGYIKKKETKLKKKTPALSFKINKVIHNGFEILYGKNNIQNDYITKNASSTDIWFHVKDIHGSHILIKNNSKDFPPDDTIVKAAELAALYSQASASGKTAVDYTFAKNVTKPKGAPTGKVVYDNYYTVMVEPAKIQK